MHHNIFFCDPWIVFTETIPIRYRFLIKPRQKKQALHNWGSKSRESIINKHGVKKQTFVSVGSDNSPGHSIIYIFWNRRSYCISVGQDRRFSGSLQSLLIFFTKYLLNQSQWTLATIIEDYAVKNKTRNKVILALWNVQNAGFYTI